MPVDDERLELLEHQVLELAATVARLESRTPRAEAVDVETAARLLSVSRTTMWGLLRAGAISSITIGRSRRIPVVEVRRLMAARREEARAAASVSADASTGERQTPALVPVPPAPASGVRPGRLGPHRRRGREGGAA